MRRMAVGMVLMVATIVGARPMAVAQTTTSSTTSTVVVDDVFTVEPGPSRQQTFVPPCNDIALVFPEQLSFVLRAIGFVTTATRIDYRLSGTAEAGVHYDPLPGFVTFPAGATTVTIPVVPRETATGAVVELTLEITTRFPLALPTPPSATIRFVSPATPGPRECGYRFTADAWNTTQTVAVGGALHPLTLEQLGPPFLVPASGVFGLVSGALPPGVQLQADGSFAGTPTGPGVFTAGIQACRPQPPGTCVTTDLTVTVAGTRVLPRTGAALSLRAWVTLAMLLLGAGVTARALAAPQRRPPEP